jgi:alpha-1,6-mannosyl-glycoprotein beta-1,2-N-acetylglucosaminyltransferase
VALLLALTAAAVLVLGSLFDDQTLGPNNSELTARVQGSKAAMKLRRKEARDAATIRRRAFLEEKVHGGRSIDPVAFREDLKQRRNQRDERRQQLLKQHREEFRERRSRVGADVDLDAEEHLPSAVSPLADADSQAVTSTVRKYSVNSTVVPFVFMVYDRIDYFRKAIASLRRSDFPVHRVPLVISHDGHVPAMMGYVETLKGEFRVVQLFHPHACYDHPDSFPGNDPALNEGFAGDRFRHPRVAEVTCCKHHFAWLLKTVFTMEFDDDTIDHFLFLEEDYVVAPTTYGALIAGLNVAAEFDRNVTGGLFGVGLDPTEAGHFREPLHVAGDAWFAKGFRSGPMTMSRSVFRRLRLHAAHFCRFDDYNWDWSLVHLQNMDLLPRALLLPSRSLAKHIGIRGLHQHESAVSMHEALPEYARRQETLETRFAGTKFHPVAYKKETRDRGFGGWGHSVDQEHCMQLLEIR